MFHVVVLNFMVVLNFNIIELPLLWANKQLRFCDTFLVVNTK